jgi:hypothetical protein
MARSRGALVWQRVALLTLFASGSACDMLELEQPKKTAPRFAVVVRVLDQVGSPLAGAKLSDKNKVLGTSDAQGVVKLSVPGREGDTLPLTVKCPETHASPEKPLAVALKSLGPGSPAPTFEARCTARVHSTLVAVRTENGEDLPIVHQGKVVARTDASGTAHFELQLPPEHMVTLAFDTSEKAALRPQNPSLTFRTSATRDELVLLEQKFTIFRKRVVVKEAPRPTPL